MPWSSACARYGVHEVPSRVTLHRPFRSVVRTDLLERPVCPLAAHDGTVELELRPFELVTLAFDFG